MWEDEDDEHSSPRDDHELAEKQKKMLAELDEIGASWDKYKTFQPAIEDKLVELIDHFHKNDIARLTPHGMQVLGLNVSVTANDFYSDVNYAMLYKNDARPDRYIPLPPKEPEEVVANIPEPEDDFSDDFEFDDTLHDPAYEYGIESDARTGKLLNAVINAMKTLAAEHYPSEIITLSAEGYRFLDERIFEIADEFTVGAADLFTATASSTATLS
jgi:hypothetical protein